MYVSNQKEEFKVNFMTNVSRLVKDNNRLAKLIAKVVLAFMLFMIPFNIFELVILGAGVTDDGFFGMMFATIYFLVRFGIKIALMIWLWKIIKK